MSATTPTLTPLAVDAKCLAELLGLSVRTIRAMDATGKLPDAVVIDARSLRWRVDEIRDWLAVGCPEHQQWEATQQHGRTRSHLYGTKYQAPGLGATVGVVLAKL